MDISLDDFISKNKISVRGRGRGRSRGRGNFRGRVVKRQAPGRGRAPGFRNLETAWKHDMYDGPMSRGGTSSKLTISNLDFGVNDNDVRELFGEFGRLRKAAVHYDRSGRSLGVAEVVFERRADALKALSQYNGVPLDGRAMSIELEGAGRQSDMNGRLGRARNRGAVGGRGGGGGTGGTGGRGRGRGRGAGRGPPPSKEDLDAELEKYIGKMEEITAD